MNSIGDEAIRNELLIRLKNISLGAGVADYGGSMRSFTRAVGAGGKGSGRQGQSLSLYHTYKKAIKDGRIQPTTTYATFKSKVNAPKRKTRGKNISCPVSAQSILNPKTGRMVKTTTPAGLRAYKAAHPEMFRLQPNNRYVCIKSYKTRKSPPVPYMPVNYEDDEEYIPETYTDDPTGTGIKRKKRCNRVSTKSLMRLIKSRGGSVYE